MVSLALLAIHPSFAGSAVWKLDPTNGDWNTAVNWMPNTVPNGADENATFDSSSITSISLSATTTVQNVTFNPAANAFNITVPGGSSLSFKDGGITNNSGKTQGFVAGTEGTNSGGTITFTGTANAGILSHFTAEGLSNFTLDSAGIVFHDNSNAGSGIFRCLPGTGSSEGVPGNVQFFDSSNAGDAEIVLDGGIVSVGRSGKVFFNNTSSAGNATVTAFGGTVDQAFGALISFSGSTTADHGTFIAYGGAVAGAEGAVISLTDSALGADAVFIIHGGAVEGAAGAELHFYQRDGGAGNSTVTINDGAGDGAKCVFAGNKVTGDTARFAIFGNGTLMNSSSGGRPLTIGSIEGDGNIVTGIPPLAVGSNNLSTLFSGTITAVGAFTKIGTGTLTLTGANTYQGTTTVEGGTLVIDNATGSGTGTGQVHIDAGTLGGSGTIAGATTVGTGSGTGAFLAPAHGTKKQATLTIQSAVTFHADATYSLTFQARRNRARTDKIVANGVTINGGATFSFQGSTRGTLSQGLVLTAISNTSASPISGTFGNLPEGAIVTVNGNVFQASYAGGDGNDLTLTVIP